MVASTGETEVVCRTGVVERAIADGMPSSDALLLLSLSPGRRAIALRRIEAVLNARQAGDPDPGTEVELAAAAEVEVPRFREFVRAWDRAPGPAAVGVGLGAPLRRRSAYSETVRGDAVRAMRDDLMRDSSSRSPALFARLGRTFGDRLPSRRTLFQWLAEARMGVVAPPGFGSDVVIGLAALAATRAGARDEQHEVALIVDGASGMVLAATEATGLASSQAYASAAAQAAEHLRSLSTGSMPTAGPDVAFGIALTRVDENDAADLLRRIRCLGSTRELPLRADGGPVVPLLNGRLGRFALEGPVPARLTDGGVGTNHPGGWIKEPTAAIERRRADRMFRTWTDNELPELASGELASVLDAAAAERNSAVLSGYAGEEQLSGAATRQALRRRLEAFASV